MKSLFPLLVVGFLVGVIFSLGVVPMVRSAISDNQRYKDCRLRNQDLQPLVADSLCEKEVK